MQIFPNFVKTGKKNILREEKFAKEVFAEETFAKFVFVIYELIRQNFIRQNRNAISHKKPDTICKQFLPLR